MYHLLNVLQTETNIINQTVEYDLNIVRMK